MSKTHFAAFGLIAGLLAWSLLAWRLSSEPSRAQAATSLLEGTWELISVERDGELDPSEVGAHLTFTGDDVSFQPSGSPIMGGTTRRGPAKLAVLETDGVG